LAIPHDLARNAKLKKAALDGKPVFPRPSGQLDIVLAARLKKGKQVGHSEQLLDLSAQVDQAKIAFCGFGGDVHPYDGAESGTVHECDLAQVEDDAPGTGNQTLEVVLEARAYLSSQTPMAFDEGGAFLSRSRQFQAGIRKFG
jgi:hypothetical protein